MIGLVSWESYGRLKAHNLRDRLVESTTGDVPTIVRDMAYYRRWVNPLLRDAHDQATKENDPRKQLHTSLALLPVNSSQVDYLYERMLTAEPQELVVIREALIPHKSDLTERLWTLLQNPQSDEGKRFRAGCGLAAFAPDDAHWEQVAGDVAGLLAMQQAFAMPQWTEAFRGTGRWLLPSLADFLVDEKRGLSERGLIARIYGKFAAETPDRYDRLERSLTETAGPDATVEAKVDLAKKQANIGLALAVMGRSEKVWPLLKHSPDPTLRSFLIDRMGLVGIDHKVLIAQLESQRDVSIKRAILLSLGEYGLDRLSVTERHNHIPMLSQLYRDDPDPGIHGSAEWLLRQWQAADKMKAIDKELATGKVEGQRQWYLTRQGQTMVVVPNPGEFLIGEAEERTTFRIDRSFAIGSKEVTVDHFNHFRKKKEIPFLQIFSPTTDCPINLVSWYGAAAYCNWLSEQEGIPKEQWCYEPNKEGKYESGMTMPSDFLQRTGYRLPTEVEWEYACRSGSDTRYYFGEPEELLDKYCWSSANALSKSHPVSSLKANDLGLFDMHGNVFEWCQDASVKQADQKQNLVVEDNEKHTRAWRGGAFFFQSGVGRSDFREVYPPTHGSLYTGFRLARTLPLVPFTSLPLTTPAGGQN